jgi:hypothetical protein
MDFFTVPTVSLKVFYVLFVIEHGRRRILHFNATFNPTAAWVIQQLREAFPYDTAPKYLIFDHDKIFNPAVVDTVRAMGIKPRRVVSCITVLGRTGLRNDGSAVAAGNSSRTWSCLAAVIC